MKQLILATLLQMTAAATVMIAGYMAINHISGWGWFLFTGAFLAIAISPAINKVAPDDYINDEMKAYQHDKHN